MLALGLGRGVTLELVHDVRADDHVEAAAVQAGQVFAPMVLAHHQRGVPAAGVRRWVPAGGAHRRTRRCSVAGRDRDDIGGLGEPDFSPLEPCDEARKSAPGAQFQHTSAAQPAGRAGGGKVAGEDHRGIPNLHEKSSG